MASKLKVEVTQIDETNRNLYWLRVLQPRSLIAKLANRTDKCKAVDQFLILCGYLLYSWSEKIANLTVNDLVEKFPDHWHI